MGGFIWLASYPKSGNTWTRAFLHNLLKSQDQTHDINKMNVLTNNDNAAAWYKDLLPRPLEECTSEEVALVRPKVHQKIADAYKGLVFLKTHNALVSHVGVPMITASHTAGAIYIVRNPLDVAVSYSPHLNVSIDKAIALMNKVGRKTRNHDKGAYQILGSWSENVHSWTHSSNRALFVMRYEDMHAKTHETFDALARHLLLNPSKQELEQAIELSSFKRLQEQEKKEGFKEKPPMMAIPFFRKGKVEEWREMLTKRQIGTIVAANRRQMARFGYIPKGY